MPTRRTANPMFRTTGTDPYNAIATGLANAVALSMPDPRDEAYAAFTDQKIATSQANQALIEAKTVEKNQGNSAYQAFSDAIAAIQNPDDVMLASNGDISGINLPHQDPVEQARKLSALGLLASGGKNQTGIGKGIAQMMLDPKVSRMIAAANGGVGMDKVFSGEEAGQRLTEKYAASRAMAESVQELKNSGIMNALVAKGVDMAPGHERLLPAESPLALAMGQTEFSGNSTLQTAQGDVASQIANGEAVSPVQERLVNIDPVALGNDSRLVSPNSDGGVDVLIDSKQKAKTAKDLKSEATQRVRDVINSGGSPYDADPMDIAESGLKFKTPGGVEQMNKKVFPAAVKKMGETQPVMIDAVAISDEMLDMLAANGNDIVGAAGALQRKALGLKDQALALAGILGAKADEIPTEDDIIGRLAAHAESGSEFAKNAIKNAQMRSMIVGLAYSMASAREGGGKLSTSDVNYAIETLGGGLQSAEAFRKVLGMVRRQTATRWNKLITQQETLFDGKNGVANWKTLSTSNAFQRIPLSGAAPQQTTQTPAPANAEGAPTVGVVEDGYRFLGGDPANPNSWELAQ